MIRKIKVKGLIGQSFTVKLLDNPVVSFIYGNNGTGKSLFLDIITSLLSNKLHYATNIPFYKAKFVFDDRIIRFTNYKSHIQVTDEEKKVTNLPIEYSNKISYYEPDMIHNEKLIFSRDVDNENNTLFREVVDSILLHKTIYSLRPLCFEFSTGDILHYNQLSDGERRIVMIWHKIIFNPKGSIIIFDCPERSLHPSIMRNLFPRFIRLNKKHGWNHRILCATHSPEIIASLWKEYNMHHFKLHPESYWNQLKMAKRYFKEGLFNELKMIIEHTEEDDDEIRIKCLKYIGRLELLTNDVFSFLENILISDECYKMRKISAKLLIDYFLDKGKDALCWAIEHNNLCFIESIRKKFGITKKSSLEPLEKVAEKRWWELRKLLESVTP